MCKIVAAFDFTASRASVALDAAKYLVARMVFTRVMEIFIFPFELLTDRALPNFLHHSPLFQQIFPFGPANIFILGIHLYHFLLAQAHGLIIHTTRLTEVLICVAWNF